MNCAADLRIIDYGPVETASGERFNVQGHGLSAFWFRVQASADEEIIVKLGEFFLKAVFDGSILTALVPVELITRPGNYILKIFYRGCEDDAVILAFKVKGKVLDYLSSKHQHINVLSKKPNFFILGAPRSGTTSMYWHLSSHPNVYMSRIKEPFFFDSRAYELIPESIRTEDDYLSLFDCVHFNAQVIGEASTTYLSSTDALQRINNYSPRCKVLVMVRDPIKASLSLFLRMKEGGVYEPQESFDDAWRDRVNRTFLNDYRNLFLIADHLEKAIHIFGENRLRILLFDDLVDNGEESYSNVLDFLGLENDGKGEVVKGNSATWVDIASIVSRPVYMDMVEYYRPQVEKLSKIIDRDLSDWLVPYENY